MLYLEYFRVCYYAICLQHRHSTEDNDLNIEKRALHFCRLLFPNFLNRGLCEKLFVTTIKNEFSYNYSFALPLKMLSLKLNILSLADILYNYTLNFKVKSVCFCIRLLHFDLFTALFCLLRLHGFHSDFSTEGHCLHLSDVNGGHSKL